MNDISLNCKKKDMKGMSLQENKNSLFSKLNGVSRKIYRQLTKKNKSVLNEKISVQQR